MSSVNTTLTGNVVNELTTFGSAENPGTRFRVAVNSRRKDRTGAWVDGNAYFVDVKCWGRLADNVRRSVRQGDPVIVIGRPETTDYTTADGQRRQSHEIIAGFIGHDLTFGTTQFRKTNRPAQDTQERPSQPEPAVAAPDPYAVPVDAEPGYPAEPGGVDDLDRIFDPTPAQ